ncbi:uncharacterized protein LOC143609252 [Bidens hawaiensis]|uniref:uncharacterized protein LOC143609252 n=1 Tax=Bidens hawaiensis TaxID=980011 RepID=UPI004049293D
MLQGKDFEHLKIGFDAIKTAENFDKKYYLGHGGYGIVYKAQLEHYDSSVLKDNEESELPKKRSTLAIKYILKREGPEGEKGFIAEIATLSSCKHPNIVSLLGFCHEDPHMILVYELVSNGSLADYLGNEGKMTNLTWAQRIKICIDIACGLDYVHTPMNENGNTKGKIIHGDIKSANILLDENLKVKIADFGLSRLQPLNHIQSTIVTSTLIGTKMYWDPEYATSGHLKVESDVYSFGVVLFELMTGRLAYDPDYIKQNEKGLAPIVRQNFEQGTLKEMVDPKLKEESDGYGFTLSKGPNKDSLHIFSKIGYQCLSEKQEKRPKLKVITKELEKALKLQETHKDGLRISLEDIQRATQNFSDRNLIGGGGFGRVYKGEILHDKEPTPIAIKQLDMRHGQGEQEFLTEVEILFEYKHENIISFVGYCDEKNESISVFEYASMGSLDKHLKDSSLTWTKRLKIGIDVAMGLKFLHGGGSTQAAVIHRDIKSTNILLTGDWKAKISDFGLSIITAIDDEMDFEFDEACGTVGYIDPLYRKQGFLTRESDIYSLGVVLFEIMCGRFAMLYDYHKNEHMSEHTVLVDLVKCHYEEEKLDELVFNDIKHMIVPESLAAYQCIAYECLHDEREKRPTASKVVAKLKEALNFQEDIEIWEAKLPKDYKELIQMSKTPEKYANMSNKDLYEIFSNGILLQKGKVFFSLSSNEERNEMISATTFSYENSGLHKQRSIQKSRFQRVLRITDVNLKYKLESETLHAYFATWEDDEWLMIELCRLLPDKKDVDFEVLLESMSRNYCGFGAIYIEGIHFQAINNATMNVRPEENEKLKGVERDLKANSDSVQQVPVDNDGKTQPEFDKKLSEANGNKCHMLSAKMVLDDSSNVKCFKWKSLAESSTSRGNFKEVAEFVSHQVFEIKCEIETQKLSLDTNYACHLIFELSEKCHGLHCPVKVQDVLLRKKKEFKVIFFRTPRYIHLKGNGRVPEHREDGLMEVIVWEFNLVNDDHVPMSLKLRCYEGNMSGLIVYAVEFRPV